MFKGPKANESLININLSYLPLTSEYACRCVTKLSPQPEKARSRSIPVGPTDTMIRHKHLLFVLAMLLITIFSTASSQGQTAERSKPSPKQIIEVENQIAEIEERWRAALEHRDRRALEPLLADDFTVTGDKGVIERQSYLAGVSQNMANPTAKIELSGREVKVYGDTAVSLGIETLTLQTRTGTTMEKARHTIIYVKQGGRWLAVAAHVSLMGNPAE